MKKLLYYSILIFQIFQNVELSSSPRFLDKNPDSRYRPYDTTRGNTRGGSCGLVNRHNRFKPLIWHRGERLRNRLKELEFFFNDTPRNIVARDERSEGCTSLKELINKQDNSGNTPLAWSVFNREYDNTKLLLEYGANPCCGSRYSIISAAFDGSAEIVGLLLQHGADPNCSDKKGKTPLSWASGNSFFEIVHMLVNAGAKINVKDKEGRTPLHWAASSGNYKIVEFLLSRGANIDDKDNDGGTALSWACFRNNIEIVGLLLDKRANPNIVNIKSKMSPLHWASDSNLIDVVKLLVEKGSNINLKNVEGETPLSLSAFRGNFDILNFLLKKGADIDLATDNNGTNLLMFAIQSGSRHTVEDIVKYLDSSNRKNFFSDISKKNNRSVLTWLVRMHPRSSEKKLNLFSKTDFDFLFGLFTDNYLDLFDLYKLDSYGGNIVYWLVSVGDYKNLKKLFDSIEKWYDNNKMIDVLLNTNNSLNNLSIYAKITVKINDNLKKEQSEDIYEYLLDLQATKFLVDSYFEKKSNIIEIVDCEIKSLISEINDYIKNNAISFDSNDQKILLLTNQLDFLNIVKQRIEYLSNEK